MATSLIKAKPQVVLVNKKNWTKSWIWTRFRQLHREMQLLFNKISYNKKTTERGLYLMTKLPGRLFLTPSFWPQKMGWERFKGSRSKNQDLFHQMMLSQWTMSLMRQLILMDWKINPSWQLTSWISLRSKFQTMMVKMDKMQSRNGRCQHRLMRLNWGKGHPQTQTRDHWKIKTRLQG